LTRDLHAGFESKRRLSPVAPQNLTKPHRRGDEHSNLPTLKWIIVTTQEMTMVRAILVLSPFAMSLVVLGTAYAQTTPTSTAQPAANPVDSGSIQALKDMGSFLQTLKRFEVSTELTGDRVLADGQKLQHTATADMKVVRPNKIFARMRSTLSERELIYDGKTVTLFTPAQKYYSTVEFTGTIGELISRLQEKYAVEMPLSDLFIWGTPAAPLDKIESAMNAGQNFVGKDLCDHYAFRQGTIDWQIWIIAGSRPLPRKVVIINRADEARPQSISLIDWNLKPTFNDSAFKFVPPKGATKIEIAPRKTN
jgi:hypothetical protein